MLGPAVRQVLTGRTRGYDAGPGGELEGFPLPDLLDPGGGPGPDPEPLLNLLELAFLGRAGTGELDEEIDDLPVGRSPWTREQFADDLFLAELVGSCLRVEVRGHRFPAHQRFLERVLTAPPGDLAAVRFRQGIVRELEGSRPLAEAAERLYGSLCGLISLLRASRDDARLQPVRFRLDVLRAFRGIVEQMTGDFGEAASGLARIREAGERLRSTQAYRRMEALLDHATRMAALQLEAFVGSDGKLRHLEIRGLRELKGNPFYRRPLRRWFDRLRMLYRRYDLRADDLTDRLVMGVYQQVAPAMARVIQLTCHLELYLAARTFAARARSQGLEVCVPELEPASPLQLEAVFNPLLMALVERPVPTDVGFETASGIAVVTGPNSGGKTRLLQAVGIAQVLGQAGLYAPARAARLPLAPGLFASMVELDRADQAEGRLGTELVRLRSLFETAPPRSLVLLDELCAGTNPSEAIEIVDTVLRLLRLLRPVAFVTTHFLDFAERQRVEPSVEGLSFLQVEVDREWGTPTFRFVPGVAGTSLAVGTARRLGVAFDELERRLGERLGSPSGPAARREAD